MRALHAFMQPIHGGGSTGAGDLDGLTAAEGSPAGLPPVPRPEEIARRINAGVDFGRELTVAARRGDTVTTGALLGRLQLNRDAHVEAAGSDVTALPATHMTSLCLARRAVAHAGHVRVAALLAGAGACAPGACHVLNGGLLRGAPGGVGVGAAAVDADGAVAGGGGMRWTTNPLFARRGVGDAAAPPGAAGAALAAA